MADPDMRTQNLDSKDAIQPKKKLKLGKSLFKKGFTKYKTAKAWKTSSRRRHRGLPNQVSNPWTIPLVPFWAIGYCVSWLFLRLREVNLNLNLNNFRISGIFRFSFTSWGIERLGLLLARVVLTVLFGIWSLLRGLWWAIKAFFLFIYFVVCGIPRVLRDCRYFIRKCTFPGWQETKRPLGVIGKGFLLIGGLSYVIKVVHLPLNEILTGTEVDTP